jgi:hypothetical protein
MAREAKADGFPYQELCAVLPHCLPTDLHNVVWSFIPVYPVRANYCFYLGQWWKLSYTDQYVHFTQVPSKLFLSEWDPLEYVVEPVSEEDFEADSLSFSYYTFGVKVQEGHVVHLDEIPCELCFDTMQYWDDVRNDIEAEKSKMRKLRNQLAKLRRKLSALRANLESDRSSDDSGDLTS